MESISEDGHGLYRDSLSSRIVLDSAPLSRGVFHEHRQRAPHQTLSCDIWSEGRGDSHKDTHCGDLDDTADA